MRSSNERLAGRRPNRLLSLMIAASLGGALAGCGGSSPTPKPSPSASSSRAGSCSHSLRAGPTCEVLWGISADNASIASLEGSLGRRFDVVYYFNGIDTAALPTPDEQESVSAGRTLHIDIEARQFALPGHPQVRWSAIAAGDFDATIKQAAAGLAALDKPFFVTFDHEADSPAKIAARGTPAQFVAAWRHIRKVFAEAGATQAIWTWVMTGYPPNFATVASLYPGNDQVDWISWDPYDSRGCQSGVGSAPAQTFAEITKPFYHWLATDGVRAGISVDKPYMISETGSADDPHHPDAAAAFYRSIPGGLAELPRIRAVTIWDQSAAGCDYRVAGTSSIGSALRKTAAALGNSRS